MCGEVEQFTATYLVACRVLIKMQRCLVCRRYC